MSYCVVIRGPLGVGKTTIASALAQKIGGHVVAIDEILERHHLEEWEEGYISERSFLKANEFAIAEALPHLRRGVPVVVDGNFYHRAAIENFLAGVHYPTAVFTLNAPEELCRRRDRDRAVPLGAESVAMVYAKVSTVTAGASVDATRPVEEIVREIVARLPPPDDASSLPRGRGEPKR